MKDNKKEDINNNQPTEENTQIENNIDTSNKKKSIFKKIIYILSILITLTIILIGGSLVLNYINNIINSIPHSILKPVIYLYPTKETHIDVSVTFKDGNFTCTYPKYENSWSVVAEPDGTIYDTHGNEYYCLYWEGKSNIEYDMSKGFVIKGEDTAEFLREKLLYMGLSPKETNEFIIYWLPQMEKNPYNLITFQNDVYSDNIELNVNPTPNSILRVFMVYQPLNEPITIEEQSLKSFQRTGFSVIEWGGSVIN